MRTGKRGDRSNKSDRSDELLTLIRDGKEMTLGQQLQLAVRLSVPAIIAQLSSIVMQYIDAAMVGHLGAEASASIGLVSTTTWLFGGLCVAAATGFSVQVAQRIGAGDFSVARSILRQGLFTVLIFSILVAATGVAISSGLPIWLGGDTSIRSNASLYFMIYSLFIPALQMNYIAGSMLRCSGNMHVPSIAGVAMCVLDVIFNFFLIFPSQEYTVGNMSFSMPGAGLGVEGAALGTALAETLCAGVLLWYLCTRSKELCFDRESLLTHEIEPVSNRCLQVHENDSVSDSDYPPLENGFVSDGDCRQHQITDNHKGIESFRPQAATLKNALRIGLPMGLEHAMICGAQIMTTVIVAPLGVFAIAANSFAVTAESLCYMPGYGISDAATTLVGQSIGADRKQLARRFANITVIMGMGTMGVMGILMYFLAPEIIGLMTPVTEIRELGVMALRVEAFAEPMFAASIVAYGVFVGAADTLVPCLMNLLSIWGVRLTLAAWLAPSMGLKGVWIAMCIELCFRGSIFLIRLAGNRWMKHRTVTNRLESN